MVESLTEKTLELEERMNEIQDEKADLVRIFFQTPYFLYYYPVSSQYSICQKPVFNFVFLNLNSILPWLLFKFRKLCVR